MNFGYGRTAAMSYGILADSLNRLADAAYDTIAGNMFLDDDRPPPPYKRPKTALPVLGRNRVACHIEKVAIAQPDLFSFFYFLYFYF